jgi:hypothetical protein
MKHAAAAKHAGISAAAAQADAVQSRQQAAEHRGAMAGAQQQTEDARRKAEAAAKVR